MEFTFQGKPIRSVWVFDESGNPLYDKWQHIVDNKWVDIISEIEVGKPGFITEEIKKDLENDK